MKIIQGKYKQEEDILKYISFFYNASNLISLVFLERLAAWVRDTYPDKQLIVMSGYRTYAQQVASKEKYPDLAATPGTSWHEFHCAVDVDDTSNFMVLSDFGKTYKLQSLYKYGLYIPMNKVDSPNMLEFWHIAPIETKGIASAARKTFLDTDDIIYGGEDMATILELQSQVKILTANVETQKGYNVTLRTALDSERRKTAEQVLTITKLSAEALTVQSTISLLKDKIQKAKTALV